MSDKKRIEELERRVKELEARPIVYPTILIQPVPAAAPQYVPYHPPWNPWAPPPHPFGEPWIVYGDGHTLTVS